MFDIGQQVVCVNAKPYHPLANLDGLAEGTVYTIRWIGEFTDRLGTEVCIRVEEIHRPAGSIQIPDGPLVHYPADEPYQLNRFRPVRKSDISVFEN